MLIQKDCILANELCEKAKIKYANIANISNLTDDDIQKFNNTIILNKNSKNFPKNIRKYFNEFEYTDLSNMLPYPFMYNSYNLRKAYIKDFAKITKVSNKTFVEFNQEIADKIRNKIFGLIHKDELDEYKECINLKMNKTEYLCCY